MTGSECKALREAAGMTQPDLARLLRVHPVTVANWEGDKHSINGRTEQLVRLYCVPLKPESVAWAKRARRRGGK